MHPKCKVINIHITNGNEANDILYLYSRIFIILKIFNAKPVLNRFVEEHPHRAYSHAQIQALAAQSVLIQHKHQNHPLHDASVVYINE